MSTKNLTSAVPRNLMPRLSWTAEELIADFERALLDHRPFDLDRSLDFIDEHERPSVVTELACIDLERSFENGQELTISKFVDNYPEVFSDEQQRSEIAKEHYRLLRLHNVAAERSSIAKLYQVDGSDWKDLPLGNSQVSKTDFPLTGSEFCGYPLLAELGEGALGRVYLARQPDLAGRLVVLKVTRRLTGESTELARLQHSGIIPVYSIHSQQGLYAICMPYLGAVTLAHLIRDSRVFGQTTRDTNSSGRQLASTLVSARLSTIASTLSPALQKGINSTISGNEIASPELKTQVSSLESIARLGDADSAEIAGTVQKQLGLDELTESISRDYLGRNRAEVKVNLMLRITTAVAHAHRCNIVHHDLKPENVLIANDGRPVLLDFNLAQSSSSQSMVGGGTIPYMSAQHLEVLKGPIVSSPTNDVFSLGVIFYQIVTGRLPYPGHDSSKFQELIELRRACPSSARKLDKSIPPSLDAIILKCLAFQPSDRYPSAVEMEEDLQQFVANLPLRHAPDHSPIERLQKWTRRHPLLSSNATLSVVALLIIAVAVVALVANRRITRRLQASRQVQQTLTAMPETLALLQSPGLEPELLSQGLVHGQEILDQLQLDFSDRTADPTALSYAIGELDVENPSSVSEQLAKLLYAMAGVRTQLALVGQNVDQREIEESLKWNSYAAKLSKELTFAVEIQAAKIERLIDPSRSLTSSPLSPDVELQQSSDKLSTYAKMLLAHEQGLSQEFNALADRLVSEEPTDPGRWFSLATAQMSNGNLSAALNSLDVSIRLQPESAATLFWRGVVRLRLQDCVGAKDDFTKCITLQTGSFMAARYNRALACWTLGEHELALQDLNWIVDQEISSPRVLSLRSQVLNSMGNVAQAGLDIQSALKSKCSSADDWVARGVLQIANDPQVALSDFQQALKLDRNNTAAYFNSAHVHSEVLGNIAPAIDSLTSLINLGQQSVSVLASRGILYGRDGKFAQARQDAEAAAKLQPKGALEMLQIAGIYSMIAANDAELSRAATWLARSVAEDPQMKILAASDPDLAGLRKSPQYQRIIGD